MLKAGEPRFVEFAPPGVRFWPPQPAGEISRFQEQSNPGWDEAPSVLRRRLFVFLGGCEDGQTFYALLGSLGEERITLRHEQHVSLGIGVAHLEGDVEGLSLQLAPLCDPSRSVHRIVPIISRHCCKVPSLHPRARK